LDALSKDELRDVLRVAAAHRERDWLMILVAYRHGLRASEVVRITPDDLRDGFLTIQRLKGSLRTIQPLSGDKEALFDLAGALVAFARKAKPGEPIFPVGAKHFWRLFRRYAELAGIPAHKRHPHVLKHSIAMHTIKLAGIENVRQYLGHKSISSTGAYLKVSDAEASEAIRKAQD